MRYSLRIIPMLAILEWGAQGQVVTFEGTTFPETEGWERIVFTDIERGVSNGWFRQFVGATRQT